MDFYSIFKQWALPPGSLLIMLALAFLLVQGTLGRLILFVAWSCLLIMSLPALSTPMIAVLEQSPPLTPRDLDGMTAQAIVVLAAGTYSDAPEYGGDTVGGNSLKRTRYAAWLHRRTGLPIYVTGGSGRKAPAPLMAEVLRDELGVPVRAIEDRSHNTWENAAYTAPLLRRDQIDHVLLVTQAWHMPRAQAAFEHEGIVVTPAPTYFIHRDAIPRDGEAEPLRGWLPQASTFHDSAYAIHEHMGRLLYQIRRHLD